MRPGSRAAERWLFPAPVLTLQTAPLLLLGIGRDALLSYGVFAVAYGQLQHMDVPVLRPALEALRQGDDQGIQQEEVEDQRDAEPRDAVAQEGARPPRAEGDGGEWWQITSTGRKVRRLSRSARRPAFLGCGEPGLRPAPAPSRGPARGPLPGC